MLKMLLPIFLLVFISACVQEEPVACTQDAKMCPDGTSVGRVPPSCEFAPCPVFETNETPAPSHSLTFNIEADDNGFYTMSGNKISGLNINGISQVKINFNVRTTNVYYGGLDFRSAEFDTPDVLPGEETTVSFVADSSFVITSYWPSSNVKKAELQVVVT